MINWSNEHFAISTRQKQPPKVKIDSFKKKQACNFIEKKNLAEVFSGEFLQNF